MQDLRAYIEHHFSVDSWTGDEAAIHCPYPDHSDGNASASINGQSGQFYCHGCGQKGNLTTLSKDLGLPKPPGDNGRKKTNTLEASYDYVDEKGQLLYVIERYRESDGGKIFWAKDATGDYKLKRKNIRFVPYGLPNVVAAFEQNKIVHIVEGEKTAIAVLKTFRRVATCNHGGSGPSKWKPVLDECFPKGSTVCLWPDSDTPGLDHMHRVGSRLLKRGCKVLWTDPLYQVTEKGGKDLADWIAEGHTEDAFQAIIDAAKPFTVTAEIPAEEPKGDTSNLISHDYSPMDWTDTGNSEALIRDHGEKLLYCHERSAWLAWISERWEMDGQELVQLWAQATVKKNHANAINIPDREAVIKAVKWALASLNEYRIGCMLRLTRAHLPVKWRDLDADPMVLGVVNGYIDLKTGKLHAPEKARLITMFSPVTYDPEATAPRWELFLEEVFEGNLELIGFVQKAVGYALTGNTGEKAFFLLHGAKGNNGKSTFVETVLHIMGAYGGTTQPDTLLDTGPKSTGGATPDLAALAGLRFLSCGEMQKTNKLDETLIKRLTGNDTIRARPIYEKGFEFQPEFKLFLATNDLPTIRDPGPAMWSRPRVIPFNVRYEGKTDDKGLKDTLLGELPGVLAWAVRGCLAWQRDGLGSPDCVTLATSEYQTDQDPLASFIEDTTEPATDFPTLKTQLYRLYEDYCKRNGEKPLSQRKLTGDLKARGWTETKLHGGLRAWNCIKIRDGIEVNYDVG